MPVATNEITTEGVPQRKIGMSRLWFLRLTSMGCSHKNNDGMVSLLPAPEPYNSKSASCSHIIGHRHFCHVVSRNSKVGVLLSSSWCSVARSPDQPSITGCMLGGGAGVCNGAVC